VSQEAEAGRKNDTSAAKPKMFYVFGHPVAMSASPIIMNTGFTVTGAPHKYDRFDSESLDEVFLHPNPEINQNHLI